MTADESAVVNDFHDAELVNEVDESELERFLRHYGAASAADVRAHRQFWAIGLSRRGRKAVADQVFLSYSVLAVEGDRLFALCCNAEPPQRPDGTLSSVVPNARVVALHYGNGTTEFPRCRLLVVLASTTILKGDQVVVCRYSLLRCADEVTWYGDTFATPQAPFDAHSTVPVPKWPNGVDYYHGAGERHRGASSSSSPPVVAFPFNLVELTACDEIGPGDLGLRAKRHIPCGTTFMYAGPLCGPKQATDVPTTSPQGDQQDSSLIGSQFVYALATDKDTSCFGQGLARYINHRYNLRRTGNVELVSVVVPGLPSSAKQPSSPVDSSSGAASSLPSRRQQKKAPTKFLQDDGHFTSLPFFVVTSMICPGEQLLVGTYGEQYDSRLEREVICGGKIIPYRAAALQRHCRREALMLPPAPLLRAPGEYEGDYRCAVGPNDVVWRPSSGYLGGDLFLVVDVSDDSKCVLLTRLGVVAQYLVPALDDTCVGGGGPSVSKPARQRSAAQSIPAGHTVYSASPLPTSSFLVNKCVAAENGRSRPALVIAATDTVGLLQEGTDYTRMPSPTSKNEHVIAIDMRHLHEVVSFVPQGIFEPLKDGSVLWSMLVVKDRPQKKRRI